MVLMSPFSRQKDYIGNVVLQKLIDQGSEHQRFRITEKIAPYMASIGIHKNGTWVVQKIIDTAKSTPQIHCIINALKSLTPPLLLDQFGNYVVQCCLRLGSHRNQFIFDAMEICCWEIAQGRFGARAMRAALESQFTTTKQRKQVAVSIVENAARLAVNPNGTLLLNWLLDSSALPGRYRALVPQLVPLIPELCTNKLSCNIILKIGKAERESSYLISYPILTFQINSVNQRVELDARDILLHEIFFANDSVLECK